jgi:hypothetical protein
MKLVVRRDSTPNSGMQGTPISVAALCWHRAGAPDAGRWAS